MDNIAKNVYDETIENLGKIEQLKHEIELNVADTITTIVQTLKDRRNYLKNDISYLKNGMAISPYPATRSFYTGSLCQVRNEISYLEDLIIKLMLA